jgi:putative ABC transport system permease protein
VGVALGLAGAWAVALVTGLQVEISLVSVLLAVGFAAGIGIFFGWYPAAKASRLRPVEALRIE